MHQQQFKALRRSLESLRSGTRVEASDRSTQSVSDLRADQPDDSVLARQSIDLDDKRVSASQKRADFQRIMAMYIKPGVNDPDSLPSKGGTGFSSSEDMVFQESGGMSGATDQSAGSEDSERTPMSTPGASRKDASKSYSRFDASQGLQQPVREGRFMRSESESHASSVSASSKEFQAAALASRIWPVWEKEKDKKQEKARRATQANARRTCIDHEKSSESLMGGSSEPPSNSFMDKLVLSPTSWKRISWDICSLLAVVYDLLTLPLTVFHFDELAVARVARVVTMAFWTWDIAMSLVTGYQSELGHVELRWHRIACDYARNRFPFDFLVVSADWLLYVGDHGSIASFLRLGKVARMTRIMKLFRMMRIGKLNSLFTKIRSMFLSSGVIAFLNILRLMSGVMLINHFFACGWYGVGSLQGGDLSGSWIAELEESDASMLTRYLESYQWSLAQFTPSSTDHLPVNNEERFFALLVLFVGLVV